MTIRVRPLLNALNSVEKQQLKKLLPPAKQIKPPDEPEDTKYPAALLSALKVAAPGEEYGNAGYITEDLLQFTPAEITLEKLLLVTRERVPTMTAELEAKITKSKTTDTYLDHIRQTRIKMRFAAHGEFRHEEEIEAGEIRGHPDYRTDKQIFEVKMTGQLKKNWPDFLFQVFAYAALAPEITDIYLVLPLQEILWHYDVRTWTKREDFGDFLAITAQRKANAKGPAHALIESHYIGSHMRKLKTLAATIHSLPRDRPSQIFLCGPQSSKLNIDMAELDEAAEAITETEVELYIHSQYLINLCTEATADNEAYHTKLLIKNLQYAVHIGARGVVVHVGKSTTQTEEIALATMKTNILEALSHATESCPILLETPSGQGTEVLRSWIVFEAFVAEINDPRLKVCIDTCHVFACGEQPLEYLTKMLTEHPGLTKLIHFNDSAAPCGSCLDRHAFVGEGEIGLETMVAIADCASAAEIPMVIE